MVVWLDIVAGVQYRHDFDYPNLNRGNHAAFFVGLGATDTKTGKPGVSIVIEQFKGLQRLQRRAIRARVKNKAEGGLYSD